MSRETIAAKDLRDGMLERVGEALYTTAHARDGGDDERSDEEYIGEIRGSLDGEEQLAAVLPSVRRAWLALAAEILDGGT
jgi:hypothetical protein